MNIANGFSSITPIKTTSPWMKITNDAQREVEKQIAQGNLLASYGIVRASIGVHNTEQDVEKLVAALEQIASKGPSLHYIPAPSEEVFKPATNK